MHVRALVLALHCALAATVAARDVAQGGHVVVYTRAELERSGYTRLADFLQRLPAASVAENALANGGGDGRELVDLRQLGPRYTQVRVDGRRWPAGRDGAVDLSAIPWSDIERIEIDHAPTAARMGEGAVAGVIDVVTRRGFRGATASARYGAFAQGDGATNGADLLLGSGDDRSSVVFGVSHDESRPVDAADRAISEVPLFGFPANDVRAGASSTTPFGRFTLVPGFGAPTVTLIAGRPGTSPTDFRPFDPASDGYNFVADSYLQTPSERSSVFAHATRTMASDVRASFDITWTERLSQQRLAPLPIAFFGIAGEPRIAADNVFNPFGVELQRFQYRNTIAPRTFAQDVDTLRASAALDGSFELAARIVEWDLAWTHGTIASHDEARGQFGSAQLAAGLGPSFRDASGTPTCGTPARPIPGCVPIDVFSGPDAFTRAMADYAGVVLQSSARQVRDEASATLAGEFAGPAGPIAVHGGLEHRRLTAIETPDALAAAGGVAGATPTIIGGPVALHGSTATTDLFIGADIPLLEERPFAEALVLSLSLRHSHFERRGEPSAAFYDDAPVLPRRRPDESFDAPAVSLLWQPFAAWRVSGDWSRNAAEPSIAQLFEGQRNTFPTLFDPCDASVDSPPGVVARCRAGIGGIAPVAPYSYFPYDNPAWTVGGNPRLDVETAITRHVGVHWAPAASGFEIGIDWYRITVLDEIRFRSAQSLVDGCYFQADLDACGHITRMRSGDVDTLLVGWSNDGDTESESYDFLLRQGWATRLGSFHLRWETSYLAYVGDAGQAPLGACLGEVVLRAGGKYCSRTASGNLVGNYFNRGAAFHRVRSRLSLDWRRDALSATASARYVSALDESCSVLATLDPGRCNGATAPQFASRSRRMPATWYVDLQTAWDTPWSGRVVLGVRNIADREPPVSFSVSDGNFDPEYEVPGRFWYAGYTQRF